MGDFVAFEMAAADALFEGVHGAVAFVLRFLEREEAFALAGVEGDGLHGCFSFRSSDYCLCPPGYRISIDALRGGVNLGLDLGRIGQTGQIKRDDWSGSCP